MRKTILRSVAVALAGMMALAALGAPSQAAPVSKADRQVPNPSSEKAVSAAAWGYWLKNRANPNLCLDGSASKGVLFATCSTTSLYQQWRLEEGYLYNFYYCLDGAVANGVRARDCNNGDWQNWYMVGENLHNWAYETDRSLDGSVSQGLRMNVTNYNSSYQHWYFQVI